MTVVMGLARNLSPLGAKYSSIALFARMSIISPQIMSEQAPAAFKDSHSDRVFIAFFIQRSVYLYWVFDVKDLFHLFPGQCIYFSFFPCIIVV